MALLATPPETITGFLSRVSEDEELFASYLSDRDRVLNDSGLSTSDRRVLATGDFDHVRAVVRDQEHDDSDACIVMPPD